MGTIHGIFVVLAAACSIREPKPPTTDRRTPVTVADQLARGARVYALTCATAKCHGTRSEGIRSGGTFRVWPTVGAEFQLRNPNAQVIFDVVRSGSEGDLRALTDQQIYDAIAYQLTLNGVQPTTLLTMHNSAMLLSGSGVQACGHGEMYPPPGNVVLLHPAQTSRASSTAVAKGYLRLRVDQVAQASAIGNRSVADAGIFSVLVFALQDLTDHPIGLDPKYLRLRTSTGGSFEPRKIDLEYPIERFHSQTITPERGTAAVAIFALPAGARPARLAYDDQTGHPLSVDVAMVKPCSPR